MLHVPEGSFLGGKAHALLLGWAEPRPLLQFWELDDIICGGAGETASKLFQKEEKEYGILDGGH